MNNNLRIGLSTYTLLMAVIIGTLAFKLVFPVSISEPSLTGFLVWTGVTLAVVSGSALLAQHKLKQVIYSVFAQNNFDELFKIYTILGLVLALVVVFLIDLIY